MNGCKHCLFYLKHFLDDKVTSPANNSLKHDGAIISAVTIATSSQEAVTGKVQVF